MLDTTSDIEITNVLGALDKALSSGDVAAAVNLFQDDCYWRDLVTFTWNIKTLEGKDAVRDMLNAQLSSVAPLNWRIAEGESATEDGGIITAWITFETGLRADMGWFG
jgi:putative flavoprotein involved in K+ transport